MKKIILGYTIVSYSVCLILSFIAFFTLQINFKSVFVFILSLTTLYSVYLIYKKRWTKASFTYLTFLNLIQSFAFYVFGISYKFILGSNLYLYYFIKNNDTFLKTSFNLLETNLYINYSDSNDFLLGINIIHFMLFIGFNYYLKKSK